MRDPRRTRTPPAAGVPHPHPRAHAASGASTASGATASGAAGAHPRAVQHRSSVMTLGGERVEFGRLGSSVQRLMIRASERDREKGKEWVEAHIAAPRRGILFDMFGSDDENY